MKTTHTGLGITETEWETNMRYVTEALEKYKGSQKEKQEVLALVGNVKPEIVEKT